MSSDGWAWWGARIKHRFDRLNGLLTVISFALGLLTLVAGMLNSTAPGTAIVLLWAGGGLFALPLLYCLLQVVLAYPPRLTQQQAAGRKLTLGEIPKLPPDCVKVALVGVGFVGKTTLLEHLAALPQSHAQTVAPEMAIIQAAAPIHSLAYLDAAGEDLTQQFEIIDHADFLVLLLDHNPAPSSAVSNERKRLQGHNIDQLVAKIRRKQKDGQSVIAVHVIRNKHDLWSQCPGRQMPHLTTWFAQQLDKVRAAMPLGSVSDDNHSNHQANDIAKVRAKILELALRVVQERNA